MKLASVVQGFENKSIPKSRGNDRTDKDDLSTKLCVNHTWEGPLIIEIQ